MNREEALARTQRAVANVRAGNFVEGWEDYRWRYLIGAFPARPFRQPVWDGQSLDGKSILVVREQGVGDEVWLASCLPDLLRLQPDRVLLSCDVRLRPLFGRSFPEIDLIEGPPNKPDPDRILELETDFHVYLGDLPRFFRRSLGDFPKRREGRGYLVVDPERAASLRERHRELASEKLLVGVCWLGGKRWEHLRKAPWDLWLQVLCQPGVVAVSLQHGDCSSALELLRDHGVLIHQLEDPDPWSDLDGHAAQISALDLVITVPNTTAHIAGAVGAPVWIVHSRSWGAEWLPEGPTTPWYPTARLFQARPESWQLVTHAVGSALAKAVAERHPQPASEHSVRAGQDPNETSG